MLMNKKIDITSKSSICNKNIKEHNNKRFNTNNSNSSKIPIYNRNSKTCINVVDNLFGWHNNKVNASFIHMISDLKIMDLPEHVKIHQNLHNRLNHHHENRQKCHKHRSKEMSQSLPSTPGSFTPKVTDESSSSIMSSSTTKNRKQRIYEDYLPLCEMQKGLQKGEIIEGILRINQRNYNDAYISAPDGGLDIYISGLVDRNKALNGDSVAVKLNEEDKWKISYTAINLNWNEWRKDFENFTKTITNIDFEKINLNSQDSNKINLSLISLKNTKTSKEELLKNEFSDIPIEIFALKVSYLKQKISYWPKFIQRTGKVVKIIKKNHPRIFAGVLKFNNSNDNRYKQNSYVVFTSRDQRNPQVIIPKNFIPKNILNDCEKYKYHLFLVKITEWESDSIYPMGKVIKNFGQCGNIDIETEIMLLSYQINTEEFPEEALIEYKQFFPDKNWKIPETELNERKDLRRECIFTIDPETAKDLDDAISYRELSNDRFEIGIHVADVSFFINENTMLDNIAKDRATSVYLVSKVIPMLPHIFCQDLCSLNPGEDKLSFSVIFTFDNEGKIIDQWFGRTIINSCCKLTYEQAQKLIESEDDRKLNISDFPQCFGQWSFIDIGARIRSLNRITQQLRTKRLESGSLYLTKKKTYFLLDEEGLPVALVNYLIRDSNRLIEELMLLANKAVGELLFNTFAKDGRAFLRSHPTLDTNILKEFTKILKYVSSDEFNINDSISILQSLENLEKINKNIFQICNLFVMKALKLATYLCVHETDNPKKYHHFALNFDKYTHFTSPIRRYADIIVHRLLSIALGYKTNCNQNRQELMQIAENCNKRKYNAFLASEKCTEIYLKAYISKIGSTACKAIVFQVFDHSFDILILEFDIIQRVYIDQLPLESYEFFKNKTCTELKLKWKNVDENDQLEMISMDQTIRTFSELDVEIIVTNKFDFKIIIAHPNGKFIHK